VLAIKPTPFEPKRNKKALLFEKRSKNFYPLARAPRNKSFLVLFSKKELLPFT